MPARLIRDDMLDSERLQSQPIEARWLYVAVLLSADDVGLVEASAFKLGRRASLDQQKIPVLLQLLGDVDLLRFYEDSGKRYIFIPRFRQRLQIKRSKCPAPPQALMEGDDDAASKINALGKNPPLYSGGFPKNTVVQRSEPEPEPEPCKNKNTRASATALTAQSLVADGLTEQTAEEWLAHRKRKRAPLTPRAWAGILSEAKKAGWPIEQAICKALERGWQSFDASFVTKDQVQQASGSDV